MVRRHPDTEYTIAVMTSAVWLEIWLWRRRRLWLPLPCTVEPWCNDLYSTYLRLSPLRACSHIRPTPRNAILFCPLPALRPGPNSTREPSSLATPTFSTSILVVPSCFLRGPAHGYSWDRYRWHSVNMANRPPSSFVYLYRDGQHPSSLVGLRIG